MRGDFLRPTPAEFAGLHGAGSFIARLVEDIEHTEAGFERLQGLSQARPLPLSSDEGPLLSPERMRRLPPNIRFQWDEGRFRCSVAHFLPDASQEPEKSTSLATSPALLQRLAARLPNHPDPSQNTNLTVPEYFLETDGETGGVLVKSLQRPDPVTRDLRPVPEPQPGELKRSFLDPTQYTALPGSITRQTIEEGIRETSWIKPTDSQYQNGLSQVTEIVTASHHTLIEVSKAPRPGDLEFSVEQVFPERDLNSPVPLTSVPLTLFPLTETCHYAKGSQWTSRTSLWTHDLWIHHYRYPNGERVIECTTKKETP